MIDALLVPLDGSKFSEETLPLAAALARSSGARLHLAHVHRVHPPEQLLSNTQFHFEGLDMREYEERHRGEERKYLADVAQRIEEVTGRPPDRVLLEGEVVDALDSYARANGAGFIAMTTHGRTGVSRTWLGSVADVLVRRSHLPVLLVRPSDNGSSDDDVPTVERILVPLDGGDLAERILEPATDVARAMGSSITLLHVVQPVLHVAARSLPLPAGHVEERTQEAETYLEGVASRLRGEGFGVKTNVVVDPVVATAVLNAATVGGADLVAMSTHGHEGVARAILGSVADKVLRGSRVPVLLERPLTDRLR